MIVVDTNVITCFFVEGDRTPLARALWQREPEWRIPALWRHEYLNVLATYARAGGVDVTGARQLWLNAETILSQCSLEVDMESALTLAIENNLSAYDAQFVALAMNLGTRLVTEDRQLLNSFPNVAVSLASA